MSTEKVKIMYEDFSGHEADEIEEVEFNLPKAAMVLGVLEGVIYSARRDGKNERYLHEFEDNAPILAVSDDGRQLLVIGGDYEVTDHGIEG